MRAPTPQRGKEKKNGVERAPMDKGRLTCPPVIVCAYCWSIEGERKGT